MKKRFNIYKYRIIYFIEAFFTALAFSSANRIITNEEAISIAVYNNPICINLAKFSINYLNGYGVNISIIFLLVFFFFYQIFRKYENLGEKRLQITSSITALLFATFMTIGNSFLYNIDIFISKFQIFITMINFIGYFFLFKNIFIFLISVLKTKEISSIEDNEKDKLSFIKKIYIKKPVLFTMLLFLICWIPYIIIFYPGTMNTDSVFQISQYLGSISWSTHHPVFLTIVYGSLMKLGRFLVNDNFGLFLNNILQVLVATFLLSYAINYIYKLTKSKKTAFFLFIFFAFFPTWPIHFYTEVKDVWFSLSFLLFIIMSLKFYKSNGEFTKKEWLIYFISMILLYLCRKNGVYTIILTFPFLTVFAKKKEKFKIIICSVLSIILCLIFIKTYMQAFNIEDGNIKEALSIPLHQTAYYYNNYDLNEEEAEAISKVIKLEDLKQAFVPESVDFVKACSESVETSDEELKEYLIVWFKMFFKHPMIYVKATLNSTYGYIYPNRVEYKDGIAQYSIDASGAFQYTNPSNLNLHFYESTEIARNILQRFAYMLRNMPFIGLLFSCGLYNWILIALTIIMIYFKKTRELVLLIPLYTILLVCIASPVNSYVRYMLPIMLSLPFLLSFIINDILKSKNLLISNEIKN